MNSPQAMIFSSSSSLISFLFYGLAITCLTSATVSASYGGNETDYHALLSFKSKITHDPYKVLTSWNHSFHFCEWSGVSCGKRHKRVTALKLNSQGLEGSLSPHVGNLSFLRELYLRNNSFQGTIPHELGRLSRLRSLHLYDNKFSGVIAANLSRCSNLEELVLGKNKLGGSIPKEMSLLSKLYRLSIDRNNLTGGIPPFLGNITSMELFDVGENPLGGSIPDTFGLWKSLTEFYSGECNLYGSIPPSMFNLSLLVKFSAAVNHLTGSLPSEFGNQLPKLEGLQLWGVLPISIGNLSDQLNSLYLGDNQLFGSLPSSIGLIPDSLGNLSLLTELHLDSNNLEGHIPSCLGKYLSQNSLSGSIPLDIKDLNMLNILDLSSNNLSGTITSSLGECVCLTILNLQGNQFQGIIPSSISSLRGLEFLNLSFNGFEGEVPVVGVFANASAFSVLGNNRLCGGLVKLELPKCKEKGSKKKRFPFFIFVIVIVPTLLIVLCCVYLLYKKKRNSQPSQSSGNERSVYKGILDSYDAKFVAVKVLHLHNRGARKSFLAECEAWRNIRHRNLLKIITSCSSTDFQGNDFKALVYEFMSNGSVHDWLHSSANTSKLNLLQRINILRDVATALDYLHNHCQTTIVHGDLKPSNILLDADMVAHVGDFGLARLLEYGIGSEMTSSGDIYSFGIVLLEVMTGKKPTDDMFNNGLSLHKFAYMALPNHVVNVIDNDAIVLQSTEANAMKMEECLVAIIKIGVSCSVDSPPQRMKIEIVVNDLQRILDVLQNI
ncbi:leucine-rich repeat protein [Tanacetum coccineum]